MHVTSTSTWHWTVSQCWSCYCHITYSYCHNCYSDSCYIMHFCSKPFSNAKGKEAVNKEYDYKHGDITVRNTASNDPLDVAVHDSYVYVLILIFYHMQFNWIYNKFIMLITGCFCILNCKLYNAVVILCGWSLLINLNYFRCMILIDSYSI